MDLAEIRKKSKRSKKSPLPAAVSTEAPPAAVPLEPSRGAAPPEPAREAAGTNAATSEPPQAKRRVVSRTAPPVAFDPVSTILAGRASMLRTEETVTAAAKVEEGVREFICFRIFKEEYALNIMEIKEIIKPREVTEVPRTPPFVAGVLSLRGTIIPILDVGRRLGFSRDFCSGKERIVVVRHGEGFCGLLVDEVSQVVRLQESAFEPPPLVLDGIDRDFIAGLGRHDRKMLILLNLEKVLDFRLQ